ncbi:MAG: hypothetical protein C0467_06115 [Planctomycetaceae bacterium]|nr:hypothetical protein [Planctomycetaceae bacterium]
MDPFPGSRRRQEIMADLERVISCFLAAKLCGTMWLDGSFLTETFQPGDADFVFCPTIEIYENPNEQQKHLIDRIKKNCRTTFPECHAHLMNDIIEIQQSILETNQILAQLTAGSIRQPGVAFFLDQIESITQYQERLKQQFRECAALEGLEVCNYRIVAERDGRLSAAGMASVVGGGFRIW